MASSFGEARGVGFVGEGGGSEVVEVRGCSSICEDWGWS